MDAGAAEGSGGGDDAGTELAAANEALRRENEALRQKMASTEDEPRPAPTTGTLGRPGLGGGNAVATGIAEARPAERPSMSSRGRRGGCLRACLDSRRRRRLRRLRRERPYGAADVFASLDYLSKTLYDRIDATQHQLVSSRAFFQGALAEHALWAPKKRQYFATLLLFLLLPLSLAASAAAVWYAVAYRSPAVGALVIAYATYIKLDTAPSHCSRPRRWARQNQISELIRDYFPIELRTATEDARGLFPADAVYLFGYHPHGVISVGCFMQFAFDTTGLSEKFKGLRFHAATLQANFYVPFFRELLLWLGIIDVSAESLRRALRSGPGAAVVVVPGGAAEALDARPGRCDLTLRKRSGFFRIALQHGAKLVPVYSFGENELYDRGDGEGSRAKALQAWLLKRLGYSAPFYLGAGSGVTGETMMPFSPVPRRHPIITVVGDPIPCPQIDDPTSDDIEAIKVLYINGLRSIFERFADKYTPSRTGDFNIVK